MGIRLLIAADGTYIQDSDTCEDVAMIWPKAISLEVGDERWDLDKVIKLVERAIEGIDDSNSRTMHAIVDVVKQCPKIGPTSQLEDAILGILHEAGRI